MKHRDKMAALCSAAVGIIYLAGYMVTDPSTASAVQAGSTPAAVQSHERGMKEGGNRFAARGENGMGRWRQGGGHGDRMQVPRNGFAQEGTRGGNSSASAPTSGSVPATGVTYKDDTYKGTGSNRIGSVEVAVTIKSGKIANVEITDCTTHYSQSRIDHLPQQVLERQSAEVDYVTGATKSVDDFKTAVQQALLQAQGGQAS